MGARSDSRLEGAIDAVNAAIEGGLALIEEVHGAVVRRAFAPIDGVPAVGEASAPLHALHDAVASCVYGGIRFAFALGGAAARLGATLVTAAVGAVPADAQPDVPPRVVSAADFIVAAMNGFAGDRLDRDGNPLAARMQLRRDGGDVTLAPGAIAAAFPDASGRLAVFVHGLAGDESWWRLHAERHYGDHETTYGSRLQADLGYSPLYLRYNSGLHVSENGHALADLLARVVAAWPVPVEELVLVGHSMGGLVIRSACHYATAENAEWVPRVRRVVCLGAPHGGAPLEKVVNVTAWMLRHADVTRPFAAALNARSAGIKDLRFGALRDEDWHDVDLDAFLAGAAADLPLLPGADHYFVAATVMRDAHHPWSVAVGDLLVRKASALGPPSVRRSRFPLENRRHFGSMTHFGLLNHPDVYTQLRAWLA